MIFDCRNKYDLEKIDIHDSDFAGYSYDYSNRSISLTCDNRFTGKKLHLQFLNVVYCSLQSCSFWHGGNSILWLSVCEDNSALSALYELQKQNSSSFYNSYLDREIDYVISELTINSGDKLQIVFEKLKFTEEDLSVTT